MFMQIYAHLQLTRLIEWRTFKNCRCAGSSSHLCNAMSFILSFEAVVWFDNTMFPIVQATFGFIAMSRERNIV